VNYQHIQNMQVMHGAQAVYDALLPDDGHEAENERRFWFKEHDKEASIAAAIQGDADTLRWISNDMGDLDGPQMHAIIRLILQQDMGTDTAAERLLRVMVNTSIARMAQTALDNLLDEESGVV